MGEQYVYREFHKNTLFSNLIYRYWKFKEEPHKYKQTDGRTDTGTSVTQFQKRRNIHHAYLELFFRVPEKNFEYHTISYRR